MEAWISLKKEFPPSMQWVKILNEEWGTWGTGMLCYGFWFYKNDYLCDKLPTHWQKLTAAEQETNSENKECIYE